MVPLCPGDVAFTKESGSLYMVDTDIVNCVKCYEFLSMRSSSNLNISLHSVVIIVCDVVRGGVNSVVNGTKNLAIKSFGKILLYLVSK